MVADNEIPTRENCDLTDDEERFLWMLVDLPEMQGASLILPGPVLRAFSKRFSDAGAMLACDNCGYEKPPVVKWRPIVGHTPMIGSAGQWVDAGQPDDGDAQVRAVLDSVRPDVHAAIIADLAQRYPDDQTLQRMKEG